jgi:hypothetical protein
LWPVWLWAQRRRQRLHLDFAHHYECLREASITLSTPVDISDIENSRRQNQRSAAIRSCIQPLQETSIRHAPDRPDLPAVPRASPSRSAPRQLTLLDRVFLRERLPS